MIHHGDPLMELASLIGISPAMMAFLIPGFMLFCNLVGRAIPDDAIGFPAVIRKTCKVMGLYLSNRVSAGISVNKVTEVIAGVKPMEREPEVAVRVAETVNTIRDGVHNQPEPQEMLAPDASEYRPEPLFRPRPAAPQSHWIVALLILIVIITASCSAAVGFSRVGQQLCAQRFTVTAAAERALKATNDPKRREAATNVLQALAACPASQDK